MAERLDTLRGAIPALQLQPAIAEQLLSTPRTRESLFYTYAKRALDIALALALLILLLPLLIIIAIAIRLDSPGPIIFVQRRVGRGGRIFDFYKFRSMYHQADAQVHQAFAQAYIAGHYQAQAEGKGTSAIFKPADDKRVTRVGRILRKTSIDELPQLINILKGDMSLVGPRPSIDYELRAYAPWHYRRLDVLPGLTGWAQIHGRSTLLFDSIVSLDIQYMEHRSLALDLWIILQTIPVVLSCRGAR